MKMYTCGEVCPGGLSTHLVCHRAERVPAGAVATGRVFLLDVLETVSLEPGVEHLLDQVRPSALEGGEKINKESVF